MAASDTIAVAFVVESSLALAEDWRCVLEYISQMFKRLDETHQNCKFCMAFVTYATAEDRPSPLLCKRFFADFQLVTKQIREEPGKLGIGQTSSGGSKGMAALEGFVAAIELFDILCEESSRPYLCHLFHIVASAADDSVHPQWNDSPALDNVTWDTLPSELKKRNINLSSIVLQPSLPRFAELHSSTTSGASIPPWFSFRASHSLLLAGFPLTQPKPGKRVGEAQNESSPDAKKPRLSQHSVDASPKAASAVASITQPHPQPPSQSKQPALPQPPNSVQLAQQHQNSLPPRTQQQHILERIRSAEEQLRDLDNAIKDARASGNVQLAEQLSRDWSKMNVVHQKFKTAVASYAQNQHIMAARQQAQARGQNPIMGQDDGGKAADNTTEYSVSSSLMQSSPAPNQKETLPIFGNNNNGSDSSDTLNIFPRLNSGQLSEQARNHLPQTRSIGGSGFPKHSSTISSQSMNAGAVPGQPHNLPSAPSAVQTMPNVAAQMQKLIDQQQRNRPPQNLGSGIGTVTQNPTQNVVYPEMATTSGLMSTNLGQRQLQPEPEAAHPRVPEQQQGQQSGNGGKPASPVWQGTLSWTGFDAQGKKDVRTFVVASTQNVTECRAETWPVTLALSPTQEPSVSVADLHAWMKRHKPVLCTFQPQPRAVDTKTNEVHYKSLVQLLTLKNVYAIAGWTLPSGVQENNVLVFPINGVGLVGAFFPVTGIPEMPRPGGAANISAMNLPPQVITQLQALTPQQRSAVLSQLLRRQQQQRPQQLQQHKQQDAGGLLPLGLNAQPPGGHANISGLLGAPGSQTGRGVGSNVNAINVGQQNTISTLSRPATSGSVQAGIGGKVSYEMLQSFMQRNPDGGSAMGP